MRGILKATPLIFGISCQKKSEMLVLLKIRNRVKEKNDTDLADHVI